MNREHLRLLRRWATGRASHREIERCMDLDRKGRSPTWECPNCGADQPAREINLPCSECGAKPA